jgi:nucleotide-binding universal stress UspA family protein
MKTLLVGVDFSAGTEPILHYALKLGRQLDARLELLHITTASAQPAFYNPFPYSEIDSGMLTPSIDIQMARELCADEYRREHQQLLQLTAHLRQEGAQAHGMLLKGDPASRILEKARDLPASMILLGSHGHSTLRKALLGSVSESVLRHAPCPVLIVPIPEND